MNPPRRGRGHPLSGTKETCVAPFALGLTPCPCLPCPSAKWFYSIRYAVPGTRADGVEVDQDEPLPPSVAACRARSRLRSRNGPSSAPARARAMAAVPQAMHRPSQPTPFVRTMVIPPSLLTSVIRRLDHSCQMPYAPSPRGRLHSRPLMRRTARPWRRARKRRKRPPIFWHPGNVCRPFRPRADPVPLLTLPVREVV